MMENHHYLLMIHQLSVSEKNPEVVTDTLNHIIGQVHKWCVRNKMSVHPGKSKVMIIRKTPFIGPLRPIYFGNDVISMPPKLIV